MFEEMKIRRKVNSLQFVLAKCLFVNLSFCCVASHDYDDGMQFVHGEVCLKPRKENCKIK